MNDPVASVKAQQIACHRNGDGFHAMNSMDCEWRAAAGQVGFATIVDFPTSVQGVRRDQRN